MRILLVSPYFPPQNAVASLRVHAFAQCWARAGHDVTVLTTAKRSDQQGLDLPRQDMRIVELPYVAPRLFERLRSAHRPSPSDEALAPAETASSSPSSSTSMGSSSPV